MTALLITLAYAAVGCLVAVRVGAHTARDHANGADPDADALALGALMGVLAGAFWPLTLVGLGLMAAIRHQLNNTKGKADD